MPEALSKREDREKPEYFICSCKFVKVTKQEKDRAEFRSSGSLKMTKSKSS